VNRIETEVALHRDRATILERFGSLSPELLVSPATQSERDTELWWRPLDHFSHLLRVERYFNTIVVAFLDGADDPIAAVGGRRGSTREEAMANLHKVNDDFMLEYRDRSFDELVRLTEQSRSETMALMARIDDDQFGVQMPGVPWSGGTIGAVLTHNGGNHFDRHWMWITDGLAAVSASTAPA
jgi:hypothetical protein